MPEQPNVMVIMTDQQRADFFSGEGFPLDTMPFLESLGDKGVRFESAYTPMPICMPARISMFTGRHPKAHGMIANWEPIDARYGRDLVQVLRDEGHELALFGKNHSYVQEEQFDTWRPYWHTRGIPREGSESLDAEFDDWMVQLGHWVSDGPTPFPLECQYPVRIVSDTIEWLNTREDRPFFAWVSFPEPHSPYQVPEPYFDLFPPDEVPEPVAGPGVLEDKNHQWQYQYRAIKRYHPECDEIWGRYRSNYCGMLRLIDDQLRRLVGAMEQDGLLENTVVVYLSDHGEFCGDYGLYRKGLALPQCTIRIPMLWFGGAIQTCTECHSAHVSVTDVFPTLCEALGVPIPEGVQGRSLWPLLTGESYSKDEFASIYVELGIGGKVLREEDVEFGAQADTFFIDGEARTTFDGTRIATSGFRRAIVSGRWKLIYDLDLPLELYDLERDPWELENLAQDGSYSQTKEDLIRELLYWSVRLDDNLGVKRYSVEMPPHNWYR
jgi:arylsulfatase A-like enzyme